MNNNSMNDQDSNQRLGSEPTTSQSLSRIGKDIFPIILALLGGIIVGGVIILFSGHNPFTTYFSLVYGAVGDKWNLASTLGRAFPIIGCGIAAAVAFKAGLFNIGGEGQLVLGALSASIVVLYLPPGLPTLALALLASMIVSGLWGLIIGWFQVQFNVPILISSLLMNYIAVGFASYMVTFPLIEPGGAMSQTPRFPEASTFAKIFPGTTLHTGVFITVIIIIITTYVMYRTVAGYELRMFGENPEFAVSCGINATRLILITMIVSGIIAGLSGANQVLGVQYRLKDGALTLPAYAWTGVMAAILSNNNPLGVVIAGLFFSAVQTGASGMERATEVPFELSYIVQAIMILLVAVRRKLKFSPKVSQHDRIT